MAKSDSLVLHRGSCHCNAVQFEFDGPSDLVQTQCNCSICRMKGNVHTIVPKARFRLLQGRDMLTLYTFNTHTAQHLFCKRCGVQSFYSPRSSPEAGYAVTVGCVDPTTITSITTETFDGQKWEESFAKSAIGTYADE